jgi:YVTN family beta-propeller protein
VSRASGGFSRHFALILLLICTGLAACANSGMQTVLPEISYPEKRSSSSIGITPDGTTLLVVNPDSNSLSLVDTKSLTRISEIMVGVDPRTVSVDLWGRRAVTANRSSGTISVIDLEEEYVLGEIAVGAMPWGVVITPSGDTAYAACEEDDWIAVIDLDRMEVVERISVEDRPNGLALSRDGKRLYVTHLLSARISVIDLSTYQVQDVIPTWVDGNLSQSIVLHPVENKAYLPLTRSNTTNTRLTFDTTVFPIVTVIDLDLAQMLPKEIISLPEADQPVGLPYDATFLPDGSKLYVVNAASNDVSVINMDTGMRAAHILVEDSPRGVISAPDGARVYVNNTLAGTVSVIDSKTDSVVNTIQVTEIPLPPLLLEGKRLFNSSHSPELSKDGWISCNTCHWEGEQDGRVWTFVFSGPRNTTSLLGMVNTYPLRWSAEWDESADSEFAIVEEQFGSGLLEGELHPTLEEPNAGRSFALDSLALFIDSLSVLPNMHQNEYTLELIEEGRILFFDKEIGCAECHPPPYYTDFQTHDVGTVVAPTEVLGPEIDTPTLLGLPRSAPYLHDGSSTTLVEVLTNQNQSDQHGMTSHLSEKQLHALEAFMISLSGR